MSGTDRTRKIYQPLHPSVRPLLDPEYVAFHDKYIQYVEPDEDRPWDGSARTRQNWPYAGSPIVEVGSVEDFRPAPNIEFRVFTPTGPVPPQGWPVFIWMHGGGFAGGDINGDNDLCSMLCRDANCVVATVGYRLAPEHPYPAAIEDVTETLKWINSDKGSSTLSINRTKIAIGGASAGANLAAVLCLIALDLKIPIMLQLLVVPVIDQTATVKTVWSEHVHAPWLTPSRMTWYRDLYLPHATPAKACEWQVSPCFAPEEALRRLPRTFFAIGGQDMLSTEGLAYAEKLKRLGVDVDVKVYEGMPHGMITLSGKLATSIYHYGAKC